MSDTPLGPGSWQASDGLWYPHEARPDVHIPGAEPASMPSGPVDGDGATTPERSAIQIMVNAVVLLILGAVVTFGGGKLLSDFTQEHSDTQAELAAECALEKDRIELAEATALAQTARYVSTDELITMGLLESAPENHSVTLRGPDGAEDRYVLRATGKCRG